MDDFILSNLHESRNEWCIRLVGILTPLVIEGIRSIFNESWKLCVTNDETNKYLMTFQNLLMHVPKWNNNIINDEVARIVERSKCDYIEDLISCVHIIQLKVLTCIRVGNNNKKIDISIPKLDTFVHKVYINAARKMYSNVYLFEKNISPLLYQKNNRELELMIQECILMAVRDSIPTESIIRAFMDEGVEHEEETFIEDIEEQLPIVQPSTVEPDLTNIEQITTQIPHSSDQKPFESKLSFNNIDSILDENNTENTVDAPKTIERLEDISSMRAMQRKLDEISDDDEDNIKIHSDDVELTGFDSLDKPDTMQTNDDIILNDIDELF